MSFREGFADAMEKHLETVLSGAHARAVAQDVRECATWRFVLVVAFIVAVGTAVRTWQGLRWLGYGLTGQWRKYEPEHLIAGPPRFWRIKGWFRRLPCVVGLHQKEPMRAFMPPLFDRERLICGSCFKELPKYRRTISPPPPFKD